jgi:hypothetical protein
MARGEPKTTKALGVDVMFEPSRLSPVCGPMPAVPWGSAEEGGSKVLTRCSGRAGQLTARTSLPGRKFMAVPSPTAELGSLATEGCDTRVDI